MKKNAATVLPLILLLSSSISHASNVGFDVNINVGNRAPQVAVPVPPPPPVVVAAPPQVVMEEPPVFIVPPALGFYVAVGIPQDIFFISGSYYLYRGNLWYQAPRYNGPWVTVPHKRLPPGLRKHRYEKIRHIRDEEYRNYQSGGDHYRGKHFRPEKEWKERRKEDHQRWKEEKRQEKEERKHHKHHRDDD
jgi:hypothetical protein